MLEIEGTAAKERTRSCWSCLVAKRERRPSSESCRGRDESCSAATSNGERMHKQHGGRQAAQYRGMPTERGPPRQPPQSRSYHSRRYPPRTLKTPVHAVLSTSRPPTQAQTILVPTSDLLLCDAFQTTAAPIYGVRPISRDSSTTQNTVDCLAHHTSNPIPLFFSGTGDNPLSIFSTTAVSTPNCRGPRPSKVKLAADSSTAG